MERGAWKLNSDVVIFFNSLIFKIFLLVVLALGDLVLSKMPAANALYSIALSY
jgi:hypothetical protein